MRKTKRQLSAPRAAFSAVLFLVLLFLGLSSSAEAGAPVAQIKRTGTEIKSMIDGKKADYFSPDLRINGMPAVYDRKSNTLYISQPPDDDFLSAEVALENAEMYIVDNPPADTGYEYSVVFISDRTYFFSKLVVTPLPIMNITGIKTKIRQEEYTPVTVTLYDNQHGETKMTETKAEIRVRGRTSIRYLKKGYRIQLKNEDGSKNKLSLLDLRKDDDWVLYAAYNDQEKIRNVFSSNLWFSSCARNNPYGVTAGMEYRFVELFQDNRYWGVYALGYPVDDKQFKNGNAACLGLLKKREQEISEKQVELNDSPLPGYEIETRDCDEKALWQTLRKIYHIADTAKNPSKVWEYIDKDSAIDIFLFVNFTQGVDNCFGDCMRNMYIAVMEDGRLLYIPWDLDQTFGTRWEGETAHNDTTIYSLGPDYNNVMQINPVYRFLKDEETRNSIQTRYEYLRQHEWSEETLLSAIDEYERLIYDSGAYERERERWPKGTYLKQGFKLSVFRDYVTARLKYMDAYIAGLAGLEEPKSKTKNR